MAKKPSKNPSKVTAPKLGERGIYLFVSITPDSIRLLKAKRVENAPRYLLRAPLLTTRTVSQFERNASELVLAAIDDDGTVTESFGWTADPEPFIDGHFEQRIAKALLRMKFWEARWRIPVADSTRYLQFYRTDFTRGPDGQPSLSQRSLGVLDLKPGGPPGRLPRLPVPSPQPRIPVPLPNLPPRRKSQTSSRAGRLRRLVARRKRGAAAASGFIKHSEALVNHGDPSTKFNIVILGDGFTLSKLPVFRAYANRVKKALTTTEPFKSLVNRINVYKVSVVSAENGVSNCPTCGTAQKNTYFSTTGCFNGTPSGTYVGTASHERIYDAVETIIPQEYAHLVVTIVNCRQYGGSAPPELGMVFVTLPDLYATPPQTNQQFMDVTLHEAGHVIANLCEEYNTCNERDPLRPYPNETTQEEVDAGTVSWSRLARPGEIGADGKFTVIHRQGDRVVADGSCQPALPAAQLGSLGAFWGCHNGSPPRADGDTTPLNACDVRGKPFYRPMAECRMRYTDAEFCRVCSHLIRERILAVSDEP
jgi:hypothetical protein